MRDLESCGLLGIGVSGFGVRGIEKRVYRVVSGGLGSPQVEGFGPAKGIRFRV